MEGERPREEKSQESQDGVPAEKSNGAAPTGSGIKPLKRGRDGLRAVVRRRRSGDPGSGTATRKGCRERSTGPCRASADVSNRRGIRGGTSAARDFRVATACRCQSQEGMSRREASTIAVRSSSEGKKPRERAGLKHIREIGAGARRRSRQERQGRNLTRAGKVREWWLVPVGLRWGGEKPRESRSSGLVPAARNPGETLKPGPKLEEGSPLGNSSGASRDEDHEADEPRCGSAEPMRR
jgi:hypothetical protein